MAFTKIAAAGIGSTETVTLHSLEVLNNATVGGVLTYEDVTNVDSVGLITARNGIVVGSGITLSKDGDGFFTGIVTATTFSGALAASNLTGALPALDGSALTGVASTENIRTNTNATFLQNINVSGSTTTGSLVSSGAISGTTGTFTGDVDIAETIVHTGDADTKIKFPAADTITAETGGTERLRINSSGKIGLNQSGPYAELDITSSVEDTTTGALSAHGIRLGAVGATNEQVIPITAGFKAQQDRARAGIGFISKIQSGIEGYAGAIAFYTRNAADASVLKTTDEKVRIDGNGLGIGTAANNTLHVHNEAVNVYAKITNNAGTRAFIGCESGEAVLYSQDDSGNHADFAFHTGGTEQCKISTTGISFPSGKGIDFSATSDGINASSSSSELFDDYEEGTWTPSASNFTITTQYSANYTKIGNVVFVQMYIQAGTGSGASAIAVAGLPFTIKGSTYYSYAACRLGGTNAQHDMVFQFGSGSTTATPFVYDGNINEAMISGQHLIMSGFYHV